MDPDPPEPQWTPEQRKLLARITPERLRRLARRYPPDPAWYDEEWELPWELPGGPPCGPAT